MLEVDDEASLENEVARGQAITGTSYDALTPLSIARLHESKEELRRNQESLRQSHLLSALEQGNKGQQKQVHIKDKKSEVTTQSATQTLSTHSVLMEHATRGEGGIATSFQMKKYSRREQILALFVKGVDVSIKDIAARIKGCSEKTIQRELNALLYDNVIERIGEKRWSRYVLR
jgi:predicted HTH transcriptional regulator